MRLRSLDPSNEPADPIIFMHVRLEVDCIEQDGIDEVEECGGGEDGDGCAEKVGLGGGDEDGGCGGEGGVRMGYELFTAEVVIGSGMMKRVDRERI